jgi:RND superfamily putative drug exporter
MYKLLGRLAVNHPWCLGAGWVVLGLMVALIAPDWDRNSQDDDIRFLPQRCPSVRGYQLLQKAFPQDVFASRLILVIERSDGPLSAADLDLVDALVADLEKLKQDEPALGLNRITSHRDPFLGKRLLSADGQCTLISVALASPYLALQTRATVERAEAVARARLAEGESGPPRLYFTGPAGIGRDLVEATASSLDRTTVATVVLVVVMLLLVYRAPLLALVPLVTIGVSVLVALKLLALCTLVPGFQMTNVSQVFAVVMLYGAGTDYCLFLISRYREELAAGQDNSSALSRSVQGVGSALAASAATIICSLGLMVLAEYAKVRCGGPAIAISLFVALTASLTLTPALLRILGPAVFWPFGAPSPGSAGASSSQPCLWSRLSDLVLSRPALIWTVSVLVLLPLALVGLRVQPSYKATGELSAASSSVAGLEALQRHFNPGEIGPVTVLLQSPTDWNSPQGREVIKQLSRTFGFIEGVVEVRSLTQPLGPEIRKDESPWFGFRVSDFGFASAASLAASRHYTAQFQEGGTTHHVTRIDVVFGTDPFDPRSIGPLEVIQLWLQERLPELTRGLGHVEAETYGVTVNARDLAVVTESDRVRINALVLGAIFLILLVLVRRPWLAGYLLATVLFSYFATLGATTLLAHYQSGRPIGEVDWRVPFFLFTILVAVGEDYNILLVTRVLEESRRLGWREGMRRALTHTGGTITSCGVIMAGTFATLMLAGLNTLVQIGFALAFGVLLDTFVVRPFLVPAMLLLVWGERPR